MLRINSDRVTIKVTGAGQVKTGGKGAVASSAPSRKADQDPLVGCDFDDEEVYKRVMEKLEFFNHDESDLGSICSSDDSESDVNESTSDQEGEGSEEEAVTASKKPSGTHVVESNGYFTFVENPAYHDIRVQMLTRWRRAEFLGTSNFSKTVSPSSFGEDCSNPVRARIVLKAWMLARVRHNGFCDAKASRRRLFAEETRKLRRSIIDISSAGAPTTGSVAADDLVRGWMPQLLLPVPA